MCECCCIASGRGVRLVLHCFLTGCASGAALRYLAPSSAMTLENKQIVQPPVARPQSPNAATPVHPAPAGAPIAEVGGVDGPEPTRFGDWEKGGRCIDF